MDMVNSEEEKEDSKSRLNAIVAVTIALLATFLGICKVKDDNIVQAMQQAQANKLDSWNYFQAKNTQEKVYSTASLQIGLQASSATSNAAQLQKLSSDLKKKADEEHTERMKIKTEAEDYDKEYNKLNYRDDQFDLSDAALAIAISLLAVTSLTQKKFLFWFAMVPTVFGVVMGCAGLFAWKIHPDFITNLLGFF